MGALPDEAQRAWTTFASGDEPPSLAETLVWLESKRYLHLLHRGVPPLRLEPAENIALTVAIAQLDRGDHPTPNIAAVCVVALARIRDEAGL